MEHYYFSTYADAQDFLNKNNVLNDYKIQKADGLWEIDLLRGMYCLTIYFDEPEYC
jgi:hypothetical protein